MLLLNAIEQANSKCYCLLDTGANALVLPKRGGLTGGGGSVYSARRQRGLWHGGASGGL